MKNKKLLLFSILFLPTLLWLILELSTINTKKLPYYGPKVSNGHDTLYYTVTDRFFDVSTLNNDSLTLRGVTLDTTKFPLFAVCFIKQSYRADNFRLAGLSEYVQYKKDKIKEIPFVIVTECDGKTPGGCFTEFKKMQTGNKNILNLFWKFNSFDSLNISFFKEKPVYVDYSFFILVDQNRRIRGYYDARYVAEIKRLIEEYQHLRLKEEKKNLLNQNKIESK